MLKNSLKSYGWRLMNWWAHMFNMTSQKSEIILDNDYKDNSNSINKSKILLARRPYSTMCAPNLCSLIFLTVQSTVRNIEVMAWYYISVYNISHLDALKCAFRLNEALASNNILQSSVIHWIYRKLKKYVRRLIS